MNVLRSAVIDGRTQNVRYRQNELHAVHATLCENSRDIIDNIAKDSSISIEVAEKEFFLGMDSIRQSYNTLNFDQSVKEEYSVARGEDNPKKSVQYGLVAIRPDRHSRFYSIITPLAAAIAAGNCVLLELEPSSNKVDSLLKKLFLSALSYETFAISPTQLDANDLSQIDLLVDQVDTISKPIVHSLLSPSESRTVAVVDRTGNVEAAAVAIVNARLSGKSSYAPDIVIVSEAVGEAFGIACLKYANSLPSSSADPSSLLDSAAKEFESYVSKSRVEGAVKVHAFGATPLKVVEILDQSSPLATLKIASPCIMILPSTSVVDTVTTQRAAPTFLASYLFADAKVAKFLSEQIDSRVSYINHIPPEILVGAASPASFAHSLHPRYTPEMFRQPRPQIVQPASTLPTSVEDLRRAALFPLAQTKQPLGRAVGFFEQGILIGLGVTAFIILPTLSYAAFVATRYTIAKLRR